MNQDPVLDFNELETKLKKVFGIFKRVSEKKKPRPPKAQKTENEKAEGQSDADAE